jgi:hypothetical protein
MGRSVLVLAVAWCVAAGLAATASAEMMRAAPGAATLYPSPNGRFTAKAAEPEGLSLREGDRVLWREPFLDVSKAAVSDDGGTVVATLWGWKDEGGSEAIAFYGPNGKLIAKTDFGGPSGGSDKAAMKWVKRLVLSPDGARCALGEHGKSQARVTLYDAQKGSFLWERPFGLEEIAGIALQPGGRHILLATRGRGSLDVLYLLADEKGEVVWEKRFGKSFTYDVKDLCRFSADGKQFEVYAGEEKRLIAFPLP